MINVRNLTLVAVASAVIFVLLHLVSVSGYSESGLSDLEDDNLDLETDSNFASTSDFKALSTEQDVKAKAVNDKDAETMPSSEGSQNDDADYIRTTIEEVRDSAQGKGPQPEEQRLDNVKAKIPSLESIRRSLREQPHERMSPEMRQWALYVGTRMDAAFADESKVPKLVGELVECAELTSEEAIISIRATCAENLIRLGEAYPRLQPQILAALRDLPREVRILTSMFSPGSNKAGFSR